MVGQIVMLGDSNTQFSWMPGGTAAALADRYQRQFDVYTRGFSGFNSEWAKRFAQIVLPDFQDLRLLILWYGTNDALVPPEPRAISLQRYQENLAAIIDLVPTETPIIVVSPPCYSSRGRARDINIDWVAGVTKLERDPDGVREYGLAARGTVEALQKARLRRIAFCDVHQPMENAAFDRGGGEREEGLSHFLHDGVHLTSKGYKVVTEQLARVIDTSFPDLNDEPRLFPDFTEVDHANPAGFFGEC